jgi:hypothetical protein
MSRRSKLSAETVRSVSAENAGNPLNRERAAAAAEGLEPILQLIDGLRDLPLKNVEPAMIFQPQRRNGND